MPLEKIIHKIEKEAEIEASHIIERAETEAKKIRDEGQAAAQALLEKMESDHMKTVEGIRAISAWWMQPGTLRRFWMRAGKWP